MQAVELYTSRQNSRIQRNGVSSKEASIDSADFDEQKQLLAEALKENNVVIAGYNST